MKELRVLTFTLLKDDVTYQTLTGGNATDPRVYYQYTPAKVVVSDTTPAYSVYYRSGTVRNLPRVDVAGRDDQVFTVEIYAQTADRCEDIADGLEALFRDSQYTTDSFVVLNCYAAIIGSPVFDDGRRLFTLSVNVHYTKIVAR